MLEVMNNHAMVPHAVRTLAYWAWSAVAAIVAERTLLAAEADLNKLDDRTLKDIGLSRGEIGSFVRDIALSNGVRVRQLRME